MPYNYKDYDEWRNSLRCDICNEQHYRMGMCKVCYKKHLESSFHCTHQRCVLPVFALTLCQRHYRSYRQRCLICSSRYVYYRHLCRKHYREAQKTNQWPIQPTCKVINCSKKVYVDGLCLKHFKLQYSQCSVTGCTKTSHRKGLCCSHYFKERRKKTEKNHIYTNKE